MRFKHLSLDEQLKQTEKKDIKVVAKAQFLQSKEWRDHIAEHHATGPKPQVVQVTTSPEDTNIFKKAEEKKEDKEEARRPQHSIEHAQVSSTPRSGYLATNTGTQRGPGDDYFGAGSARLRAISGQCSCGMEISTGFQDTMQMTAEQRLKSGYTSTPEREATRGQEQAQPLYNTGAGAPQTFGQERQMYTTGNTTTSGSRQKPRRTTAL